MSDPWKPGTFSTKMYLGRRTRSASMPSRCTRGCARASAASRPSPRDVNGWHGGDIVHRSAPNLSICCLLRCSILRAQGLWPKFAW